MFDEINEKIKKAWDKRKAKKDKEKEQARIDQQNYKRVMALADKEAVAPKQAPADSFVSLQHINKIYPNKVQAIFDFNLDIKEKEFVVLVGPSGCGKSTLLRMIAGLEDITSGNLFINGKYSNFLEPKDRHIAMVFQNYALYPHMTVYQNLAFGLKIKHLDKNKIDKSIQKAADILEIKDYLNRKPKELSGGQQQRVALGRAIVKNENLFLMDEPLSNLDAKLRNVMRGEIVNLHNRLAATTIYVTHDQTEAMTMATKIVVMNHGVIQQIGSPSEVYGHPSNVFVASFIGTPSMNLCSGIVKGDKLHVMDGVDLSFSDEQHRQFADYYLKKKDQPITDEPQDVTIGFRPEDITAFIDNKNSTDEKLILKGKIFIAELVGNEYYLHVMIGNNKIIAKAKANSKYEYKVGAEVNLSLDPNRLYVFDNQGDKSNIVSPK